MQIASMDLLTNFKATNSFCSSIDRPTSTYERMRVKKCFFCQNKNVYRNFEIYIIYILKQLLFNMKSLFHYIPKRFVIFVSYVFN